MADDDRLPIELGPVTNGEYVPAPTPPLRREAERRSRELVDRQARRRGMSRRDFLRTSMATAAMLFVLDACSSEEQAARGRRPGGRFRVPEEATVDPDAAAEVLGGDELVFDVQTHFLEFDLTGDDVAPAFPQAGCGEPDPRSCFDIAHFLDALFLRSDTTMAVLSAVPAADDDGPLSTRRMAEARAAAEQLCGDGRVLLHGHVAPGLGRVEARLDGMDRLVEEYPIAAWKVYTSSPARWFLDDHDASLPRVGQRFLDRARVLGVKTVCVHKGLGDAYASPVDVGPTARANPDLHLVVYHSGYEAGVVEGPYDPDGPGVDRFVRTLRDNDVRPGTNVWAELGTTWFNVMRAPDEAAHVLGKLLTAVGPERVLWGTDSIWYGSPQAQIEAFRVFEITPEYQERFGYPALTPEVKRRILGANAAALYGVEPRTTACSFTPDELAEARRALAPMPAPGADVRRALAAHVREHWTPAAARA